MECHKSALKQGGGEGVIGFCQAPLGKKKNQHQLPYPRLTAHPPES